MLIVKILTWWLSIGIALSSLLHQCPPYIEQVNRQKYEPWMYFVVMAIFWPIVIPWAIYLYIEGEDDDF